MTFLRYILIITITLLSITLTTGCGEKKVYKIGVSQCSHDDWREKMNAEIDREIMFHEDAMVEIRSADDNNKKQIEDIRYFADNGFDILIVSPNEAAELTPVIREVYEAGMPVIIFDRNIIGDSYTARIGVNDKGLGSSAAHYALHMLGDGARAIEIFGLPGSTPAEDRHKGFAEEFEAGGGKLLGSAAGNWKMEDAIPVADSLLKAFPATNIIYAHNDRMAIGAAQVAEKLGRPDISIIGIDAAPKIGIKAVADSVIDATFLYPTEGHRLIRTALAILKGEHFDREVILPVSSAVDASNADILLLQNEALEEETDKMKLLKNRIDDYWAQHSSQTSLFYASIAIIALLFGVIFLVLRAYWQHKRHQQTLVEQNRLLEEERDKQRELNTRLQEATQSKLMFFTNVSHDLRTPLTLIAEPVAQLAAADNLSPSQLTLIRIADKNVRILKRLINQILDFRKYENDRLELNLTEVNLDEAMREWVDAFDSLARKRHLKLSLHSPADKTTVLALDIEKFERVVFNLISNAFKYTPDNGSVDVSYCVEDDKLRLSVADTGQGISEREMGNIFDRFYQVDRVHPNGSGIGLSLCKAFVELHEGRISVESTLDKGSVFTVQIPVRHVSDTPETFAGQITREVVGAELDAVDSEPQMDDERPLVLVIDDNRDIQTLVAQLLAPDYNVIVASDGAEGVRRAMKYVPDLIICDVMMPGTDGLECCRRLKSEISTSHIPVLLLTACSMDEQRVQGFDSGADGYMAKPFSNSVLRAQCSSLIANRRRIKEIWCSPLTVRSENTSKEAKPATGNVAAAKPIDSRIDNDFYARFVEIFNEEMANPDLTVDSLASRLGLERSQFYRKIKALTNFSPVELMRNMRLAKARQLLTRTDKSVSEIAYETGFSTPAYFSKCFRDAYGETPTELRNKNR